MRQIDISYEGISVKDYKRLNLLGKSYCGWDCDPKVKKLLEVLPKKNITYLGPDVEGPVGHWP
jgi:hypothetical protein